MAELRRSVLGHRNVAAIPARQTIFDPAEFYQQRSGLWLAEGFRTLVLRVAKPVNPYSAHEIGFYDVLQRATRAQIRKELPKKHVFEDLDLLCAYLASMIEQQSRGEGGPMRNDSYANGYYVRIGGKIGRILTCFSHHDLTPTWSMGAYPHLRGMGCVPGHRIFSCA